MKNYLLPLLLIGIVGILFFQRPKERLETPPILPKKSLKQQKEAGLTGPRKFFEYHKSLKTRKGDAGPRYTTNYRQQAFQKAKSVARSRNSKQLDWIERGPGNVSGRTRSIFVDPRDDSHRTWLAGSVGGGVWRTTDAGETWTHLTSNMASLATSTIACSNANPDIIYVGTGEGITGSGPQNGSGIFKSTNNGASFEAVPFTQNNEKFGAVTRLAISQVDPNLVYASTIKSIYKFDLTGDQPRRETDSYIFKTTDGGTTWEEVFSTANNYIQQIVIDPANEQNVYAMANGLGIFKSINGGKDWEPSFDATRSGIQRIEMAIAPTNSNMLYAACEAPNEVSVLFKSVDEGQTWLKVKGKNVPLNSWLGTQGSYDNTIAVHPFNENIVFLGGQTQMLEVDTDVGFAESEGLAYSQSLPITGAIEAAFSIAEAVANDFGMTTGLTEMDLEGITINININQGTTNAFRFSEEFEYVGQAMVPLKVFNQQGEELALTFADFNGNGVWDYEEGLQTEPIIIYKHPANEMLTNSITSGNVFGQAMYLFTPIFVEAFDMSNLPPTTVSVENSTEPLQLGAVQPISDFEGVFQSEFPDIGPNGIHPDHHYLIMIPIDESTGSFYILMANDGGLAFSKDNGQSFVQTGIVGPRPEDTGPNPLKGYNTAQFYGVDKMNGTDRYIGGTQDNGVWVSPENPTDTSDWVLAPSGDGFETAWHYLNPNWLLQTSQNNELRKSIDGGITWNRVQLPPNTGPFITRLANSKQEPDFVCMISAEGLLKSYDFGDTWEIVPLPIPKEEGGIENNPLEISIASPRVVWTGTYLETLVVSEDAANSFKRVKEYGQAILGPITSIYTHPFNPRKAYVTYSIADGPKVIMTDNLGESWTDLSGFITHNTPESNNGFPDVPTTSLLVMPYDTTILWAGTDIGLFESIDSGNSWHYADNGLPAVSIWEMKVVNDEVVIATHGRGIWTVSLPELQNYEPIARARFPKLNIDYNFATQFEGNIELLSAFDSSKVVLELMDGRTETIANNDANTTPMTDAFTYNSAIEVEEVQFATIKLYAYQAGEAYITTQQVLLFNVAKTPLTSYENDFENDLPSFAKLGFTETPISSLNTTGLQTIHPYEDMVNYFSIMKQPILIENPVIPLTFDEIVLVEPGVSPDPDSEQFFDYVRISATKDFGRTWIPLAKYDASEQAIWLSNFDNPVITPELVFSKTIEVGQQFDIGDTLYFRFDLVSDFDVRSWGWYVDNIKYGDVTINTSNIPTDIAELKLFPNPAKETTTIIFELERAALTNITIYDVQGKIMYTENMGKLSTGLHQLPISLNGLTAGSHVLQLTAGSSKQNVRFIKI